MADRQEMAMVTLFRFAHGHTKRGALQARAHGSSDEPVPDPERCQGLDERERESVRLMGSRVSSARVGLSYHRVPGQAMRVFHAGEPLPEEITHSVFLMGPTPRAHHGPAESWRGEALRALEGLGFAGEVL